MNKLGRCKPCTLRAQNADPAYKAKRTAGIQAKFKNDPAHRAKMAALVHAGNRAARANPANAERLNANIRKARERLNDPDVRAKCLAGRPAAARKRSQTVMAWCPEQHRAEYERLTRTKRMRAGDAKRLILSQLTPFERQMHALTQGARLVERLTLRTRAYDFTLGGVTDFGS